MTADNDTDPLKPWQIYRDLVGAQKWFRSRRNSMERHAWEMIALATEVSDHPCFNDDDDDGDKDFYLEDVERDFKHLEELAQGFRREIANLRDIERERETIRHMREEHAGRSEHEIANALRLADIKQRKLDDREQR